MRATLSAGPSRPWAEAYALAGLDPAPPMLAAKRAERVVTLDLFDVVGADMFGEGITARAVAEAMPADIDTIRVRINSPGGVASEGHAIRTVIRGHAADTGARVIVEVHGLAASAATVIAMAGDEIHIAEDARFMIHEAHGIAVGSAADFERAARAVEAANEALATAYTRRTGKTKAEVRKLMAAETWYTGAEAVEAGFADGVIAESSDVEASASERIFAALHDFESTPPALLDRYRSPRGEQLVAAMVAAPEPDPNPVGAEPLNPQILSLLGLEQSAGDSDVVAAVAELSLRATQAEALATEAAKEAREASEKATALEVEKTRESVAHRIKALEMSGRATPAEAKALTAKFAARAEKGSLAIDLFLEDLAELEGKEPSPLAGRSVTVGQELPTGDASSVVTEIDRKLYADAGLQVSDETILAQKRKFAAAKLDGRAQ